VLRVRAGRRQAVSSVEIPRRGKFRYDGMLAADKAILSAWAQLGQVTTIDEFVFGKRR
jgi:hypothetical protein